MSADFRPSITGHTPESAAVIASDELLDALEVADGALLALWGLDGLPLIPMGMSIQRWFRVSRQRSGVD